MEEIWKDIKGFEGLYQVSNFGRVKRNKRIVNLSNGRYRTLNEAVLKGTIDSGGYITQNLVDDNGKHYKIRVHRLVACSFISNPENKKTVDHINRNKLGNNINNLRWATSKEQRVNQEDTSKQVLCNGVKFKSLSQASCALNIPLTTLWHKVHDNTEMKYQYIV